MTLIPSSTSTSIPSIVTFAIKSLSSGRISGGVAKTSREKRESFHKRGEYNVARPGAIVKKDALSAVIVIVVIFAFAYGISAMHAPAPMQPTHPFTMDESAAATPAGDGEPKPAGRVILRVN